MKRQSSHASTKKCAIRSALAAIMLAGAGYSQAFDGCKVLLCLAGAWPQYADCKPDVPDALKCMGRGKCWPTCRSSGLNLSWSSGAYCPPQYVVEDQSGNRYCSKNAVLDLESQGVRSLMRIWMNTGANDNAVSYEYSPAARAYMPAEQIDQTFDNDYAAWLARQPEYPWGYDNGGH